MAKKSYAHSSLQAFCANRNREIAERALNDSVKVLRLTAEVKYVGTTFDWTHAFQFGVVRFELTPSAKQVTLLYKHFGKKQKRIFPAGASWYVVLRTIVENELGNLCGWQDFDVADILSGTYSYHDRRNTFSANRKCIALGWLSLESLRNNVSKVLDTYQKFTAKQIAQLEAERDARIKLAQSMFR